MGDPTIAEQTSMDENGSPQEPADSSTAQAARAQQMRAAQASLAIGMAAPEGPSDPVSDARTAGRYGIAPAMVASNRLYFSRRMAQEDSHAAMSDAPALQSTVAENPSVVPLVQQEVPLLAKLENTLRDGVDAGLNYLGKSVSAGENHFRNIYDRNAPNNGSVLGKAESDGGMALDMLHDGGNLLLEGYKQADQFLKNEVRGAGKGILHLSAAIGEAPMIAIDSAMGGNRLDQLWLKHALNVEKSAFGDTEDVDSAIANDTQAFFKGMGGATNNLAHAAILAQGISYILVDKAAGILSGQDVNGLGSLYLGAARRLDERGRNFELNPDSGFAEKLLHGAGGMTAQLPLMFATGGGSLAANSTAGLLPRLIGGASQGARAMIIPAVAAFVNTGNKVYEKTGDPRAAYEAALMTGATTLASGMAPMGLSGGLGKRIISGFGFGAATGEATRQLNNLALPESMRQNFDLEDFILSGLFGAAGNGAHAVNHAEALKAARDSQRLNTISEISQKAALREGDPGAYRQMVRDMAESGDLHTLYVDGAALKQAMEKHGVGEEELAATLPGLASQLPQAIEGEGDVRIPVEDYATHIAGSKLDADLLPHFKADKEGMTHAEGQAFLKRQEDEIRAQAEQVSEKHRSNEAWRQSQQAVHDDILQKLESTGRMPPEMNQAYAALHRDFFSVLANRLGIKPHEAYDKYGADVRADAAGGENFEQAKRYNGSLAEFAKFKMENPNDDGWFAPMGDMQDAAAKRIKDATGIDTQGARVHAYASDVSHASKGHPDLTDHDWNHAFSLLANHDLATEGKVQRGAQGERIALVKHHPEGKSTGAVYELVSNPRYGRRLILKTLFTDKTGAVEGWFRSNGRTKEDEGGHGAMLAGGDSSLPNNPHEGPKHSPPVPDETVHDSLEQSNRSDTEHGFEGSVRGAYNHEQRINDRTRAPIVLKGDEVHPDITPDNAVEHARNYFKRNLQGKEITREGFGTVKLTGKGFTEGRFGMKHGPLRTQLFPAIPEIIRSGDYRGREEPYKPRKDGIVAFHFFSAPVEVGGKRITAGISVEEDRHGNLFYNVSHSESPGWKSREAQGSPRSAAEGPGPHKGGEPTLKQDMPQSDSGINLHIPGKDSDASARGYYNPESRLIGLLQHADASTFPHESAHLFLDIYSRIAAQHDAPPPIKADMDATLKWFGVKDLAAWHAMSLEEQRPFHEQFARGFETYLMEGRAPSPELRPIFRQLKEWLLKVYQSLDALGVKLSPEARGMMDRMLAQEKQSAAARVRDLLLGKLLSAAAHQRGVSPGALYRQVASTEWKPGNPDHVLRQERDYRFLRMLMSELVANHPEVFRTPISKGKTVPEVLKDHFGAEGFKALSNREVMEHPSASDLQKEEAGKRDRHGNDYNGRKSAFYWVKGEKPADGFIFQHLHDADELSHWIDISTAKQGGGGSRVYTAIGDYANNAKKIFDADENGLNDNSIPRRSVNMLNIALRHGTTRWIAPGKQQRLNWKENSLGENNQAHDLHNFKALVDNLIAQVENAIPETREVYYDFERRGFFNRKTDQRVGSDDFSITAANSRAARKAKIGANTIRQAIVLKSILRGENQAGRDRVIRAILDGDYLLQGLEKSFYQSAHDRGNPPARPGSTSEQPLSGHPLFSDAEWAKYQRDLRKMSPEDRGIAGRFARKLEDHVSTVAEYSQIERTQGGKLLDTDLARELCPDYHKDRTKAQVIQRLSSAFIRHLYAEKLEAINKPKVLLSAGGPGSGKSTVLSKHSEMAKTAANADIVYDTTMSNYESAKGMIDEALGANGLVKVVVVIREPVDALVNGALRRASEEEEEFGSGRPVSLDYFINAHTDSIKNVFRLAEAYKNNPDVKFSFIDNTHGKENINEVSWEQAKKIGFQDVETRAKAALEKEYQDGKIGKKIYTGFKSGRDDTGGTR